MPQPGDERAARRASLRASHAEREQVVDTLKDAFVQGRLTKDEFDSRVAHALAGRTYADLATLSADLPALPPVARPPRKPVAAGPANPAVRNGSRVIAATTVLTGGVWAGALLSPTGQALGGLVFAFTFLWFGIVVLVGSVMLESRSASGQASASRPLARHTHAQGRLARGNEPGLVGDHDQLGAVMGVEFHQQAADVCFGCRRRDVQALADLSVRPAAGHFHENLPLPGRQGLEQLG
jgi:hypothetical protein